MLSYICASFNQNNKKQTKMKKIILVAVVAGMTALVSCGDGGAEAKAKTADSLAKVQAEADTAAAVKAREEAAAKAPVKKK